MSGGAERVRARLFELRDEDYQAFMAKLLPNLAPASILGVRTPALRKLARELSGTADAAEFMAALPHGYFEENNLHGFLIEGIRDWDACAAALRPGEYYVDMMAAWYFATALAKQWDAALPYIEARRLPEWTHNKAIQKAVESDRIPGERKKILRDLKISSRKRS